MLRRLLAADVRSLLCSSTGEGNKRYHNDSGACDAMLNLTSWSPEEFFDKFAGTSFASLLSQGVQNNPNFTLPPSLMELHRHMIGEITLPSAGNVLQRPEEDALLWSGPNAPAWVACNQKNKACYGKIPKDVWYTPEQRAPACLSVFSDQIKVGAVKSSAEGIDICNLNSQTDKLCQVKS